MALGLTLPYRDDTDNAEWLGSLASNGQQSPRDLRITISRSTATLPFEVFGQPLFGARWPSQSTVHASRRFDYPSAHQGTVPRASDTDH